MGRVEEAQMGGSFPGLTATGAQGPHTVSLGRVLDIMSFRVPCWKAETEALWGCRGRAGRSASGAEMKCRF